MEALSPQANFVTFYAVLACFVETIALPSKVLHTYFCAFMTNVPKYFHI